MSFNSDVENRAMEKLAAKWMRRWNDVLKSKGGKLMAEDLQDYFKSMRSREGLVGERSMAEANDLLHKLELKHPAGWSPKDPEKIVNYTRRHIVGDPLMDGGISEKTKNMLDELKVYGPTNHHLRGIPERPSDSYDEMLSRQSELSKLLMDLRRDNDSPELLDSIRKLKKGNEVIDKFKANKSFHKPISLLDVIGDETKLKDYAFRAGGLNPAEGFSGAAGSDAFITGHAPVSLGYLKGTRSATGKNNFSAFPLKALKAEMDAAGKPFYFSPHFALTGANREKRMQQYLEELSKPGKFYGDLTVGKNRDWTDLPNYESTVPSEILDRNVAHRLELDSGNLGEAMTDSELLNAKVFSNPNIQLPHQVTEGKTRLVNMAKDLLNRKGYNRLIDDVYSLPMSLRGAHALKAEDGLENYKRILNLSDM